jgi:phospholipid/cholesterol/gamma-HCH transport system ATP-binding protein
MIRVRDLTHRFGDNLVLKGVSLHVDAGETVAVMGSSGGGKTTLLRCMAGLLRPTAGTVEILGTDLYSAKEREVEAVRRRLGVVFQGSALFDYLNVSDNIAFGVMRQRNLSRAELENLVADKLGLVGLPGIEKLMPSELSGGMKKRVGVARALASDPELLFYDEPTSGLDPITAYALDGLIRHVAGKTGATSVVITHDLHSVLRVATRVVFLYEGEIVYDGSASGFHDSKDPRIADVVAKAEAEALAQA